MSTRSPGMHYTAQGLGDRMHLVSLSFEISKRRGEKVALHLASNHLGGRKRDSFLEIVSLFPMGYVELRLHDYYAKGNLDWKRYLTGSGVDAHAFAYRDHLGWLEAPSDFDASIYLFNRHLITPTCTHGLEFPENFVTVQWDSTGRDRQLPQVQIERIEDDYMKEGYQIVVLGGQSQNETLRECLSCSAEAICRSALFAGVDSGFFHLALQIKKPSQIHLYTARNRFWSHHLFRAIEMGCVLNYHTNKISRIEFLCIKLRYDCPILIKAVHQIKRMAGIESYENHD